MKQFDLTDHPHRRLNALTGEWVMVSPHRAKRPWQGKVEDAGSQSRPAYDPTCYLCPGNIRADGENNPDYKDTFVFTNDFSALIPETPAGQSNIDDLLVAKSERGICRVICYSPRHDLTLAEMEVPAIRRVVDLWTEQYKELGDRDFVKHVQIFENKGDVMGCSNPHPHGQIWAQESIPAETVNELWQMGRYYARKTTTLLGDYLQLELKAGERIVYENDSFVALVPYWATWPFETLVLCRRHVVSLAELEVVEKDALADAIKHVTVRYDNLFNCYFPYSAGFHQAPTDNKSYPEFDFHMHFYPPLLRSATVKKFMVGYEMLADAQRDITPETSAEQLRGLSDVHYTGRSPDFLNVTKR